MKLLKSLKYSLIALVALCTSCTHPDFNPVFYPETDMYTTWSLTYNDISRRMSSILRVNEIIAGGDTLKAQQTLTEERLIIRGWEKTLNMVGTRWVGFSSSGTDTLFIVTHNTPGVLTYEMPCPERSKYNHSSTVYGCQTHYSITLQQIKKGVYRINGSGYINSDGSADLNFEMHDISWGGPRSGKLTLTAYAHKYEEFVTYHYTLYEKTIECEETKQDITPYLFL